MHVIRSSSTLRSTRYPEPRQTQPFGVDEVVKQTGRTLETSVMRDSQEVLTLYLVVTRIGM